MPTMTKIFKTIASSRPRRAWEFWFLALFIVIPFNVVYHFHSAHSFVDGRYVNYLDFVVHLVDIAVVFVNVMLWRKVLRRDRVFLVTCAVIVCCAILQYSIARDCVVLYYVIRQSLYLTCFVAIVLSTNRASEFRSLFSRKFYISLILILSSLSVLQSVLGIVQFSRGRSVGILRLGESVVNVGSASSSSVFLSDGYHLRAYGTFPHPNVLGGYLVVSLLLLLVLADRMRGRTGIALVPVYAVIVAGIAFTFSRVAWVLCLVTIACWSLRLVYRRHPRALKGFVFSVVVILVFSAVWIIRGTGPFVESLRGRLIEQTSSSDVSVVERRELAERAIELFKSHPWWGVGPGRFIIESSDNPVYTERGIRIMQPVHNVFLLFVAENGIVGVGFLSVVLLSVLRKFRVSAALVISLFSIVGIALFDHYLWTLPQGMSLVLMLAFACSRDMVENREL